jgi:hypothetical protein
MSERWFFRLFVAVFILAAAGAVWGAASCDWKLPEVQCDEEEDDDCDTSVRTGSSGHSRSYSHGGKY